MRLGYDDFCGEQFNDGLIYRQELQNGTHYSDEYRSMSELFNTTAILDDCRAFAVTVSSIVKSIYAG